MDKEEEYVQYYVINTELTMSGPKIGVQMAHAAIETVERYQDTKNYIEWKNTSQKKIALKGKEKDVYKMEEEGYISIHDNGHTEVPPNSLTVAVLPPMKRKEVPKWIRRMQLLKD